MDRISKNDHTIQLDKLSTSKLLGTNIKEYIPQTSKPPEENNSKKNREQTKRTQSAGTTLSRNSA